MRNNSSATESHCRVVAGRPVLAAIGDLDAARWSEPLWYAAYTRARHEKQVFEHFTSRSIECFLPLYETVRQWRDRRCKVWMPLFPSYVFVRVAAIDRMQVLKVPGVANLVSSAGQPVPITGQEIDSLRILVDGRLPLEPHPYLVQGQRVRVESGPFAGCQGIFVRMKGMFRLVVSIHLIARAVAVEVDAADVVPV